MRESPQLETNDAHPPVLNGPAPALAAWWRSPILRLAIVAALLSAGKVLLYTAGTTLFLSRQGIDALPALYLTLAVIATCVSLLLAAVIDRATPAWLLPGLAVLVALAIGALLVGLAVDWELVPAAILITAHVYDIVTDIVFWLLAAALLDNLRLRRHTPRLFIAIAVGGSVAGIIAERALATVAIEHLLWPVIGLVCIAVALFGKAAAGLAAAAEGDQPDAGQSVEHAGLVRLADLRHFLARHPFALCLALNSLLLTTVYSLTEYVAYAIYSETFQDEVELGRLLALLFAALQVAELAVLWFGAHGMVERAGPMLRNLLFPLTSLACLLALLVQPRLGWAIVAHLNTEAVSNGVFEPVNATNYGALPIRVHGRARTLADGMFYPLGMAFAGLVLTFLPAADAVFRATLLAVIASLFFVALNVVIARSYLPTLLRQLRHGDAGRDRLPATRAPVTCDTDQLAQLIGGRSRHERRLGIELIEAAASRGATAMPASVVPSLIGAAPRLDDGEWVRVARLLGHLGPQRLSAALTEAIETKEAESIELVAAACLLADLPLRHIGPAAAPGSFLAALLSLAVDRPSGDAALAGLREWLGNQAVRDRVAMVVRAGSASLLHRLAEQPLVVQHRELKTALLAALAALPADAAPGTLHPFIDDLRTSPLPQHRAAALRLMAHTLELRRSGAVRSGRRRTVSRPAGARLASPRRSQPRRESGCDRRAAARAEAGDCAHCRPRTSRGSATPRRSRAGLGRASRGNRRSTCPTPAAPVDRRSRHRRRTRRPPVATPRPQRRPGAGTAAFRGAGSCAAIDRAAVRRARGPWRRQARRPAARGVARGRHAAARRNDRRARLTAARYPGETLHPPPGAAAPREWVRSGSPR